MSGSRPFCGKNFCEINRPALNSRIFTNQLQAGEFGWENMIFLTLFRARSVQNGFYCFVLRSFSGLKIWVIRQPRWQKRCPNRFTKFLLRLCLVLLLWAGTVESPGEEPGGGPQGVSWSVLLSCAGGGWWQARVPVIVRNKGPVAVEGYPITVSLDPDGALPLAGRHRVEELRVCNSAGVELLFAVRDQQGRIIRSGLIPKGARLVLPAVCGAQEESTVFVYFENPLAWAVPDFFEAYPGIINGDLEFGSENVPEGWRHDPNTREYRTSWTKETAKSGQWALKTEVSLGAPPSWISTRQGGIVIRGGARYRLRGWVKADNVEGYAGWYLHLGNEENPMISAPMLSAGGGTYDWKAVEVELTTPPAVTRASVGTVLWGTGTAWFDAISLECLDDPNLEVLVGNTERLDLSREIPPDEIWSLSAATPVGRPGDRDGGIRWEGRARVRWICLSPPKEDRVLVAVGTTRLKAHLGRHFHPGNLVVTVGGEPSSFLLGDLILFEAPVREKGILDAFMYFTRDPVLTTSRDYQTFARLVNSPLNRVRNPSFEIGEGIPEGWQLAGIGPGGALGSCEPFDPPIPGLGGRVLCLEVPEGIPSQWRGFRQSVPVEGGKFYFVAGYLRTEKLEGKVQIHVHRRQADGSLAGPGAITSVGRAISSTEGWELLSGIVPTTPETAFLEIHLTTNCPGKVFYDGILVAEVMQGWIVGLEAPPTDGSPLQVWPVSPLVKVFPDTLPPLDLEKKRLSELTAARGEWEILQLAVRSCQWSGPVAVEVEPPRHSSGQLLADLEVLRCGMVPVDTPSNYYRHEGPVWERRIPRGAPGCDGWPGWWPDPLIPTHTLTLKPGETQAVWVIFKVAETTRSGVYRGRVLFRQPQTGQTLAVQEIAVRVWEFTLPSRSRFIALYDVRYGPGRHWWAQPFEKMYPKIVEFMAERRLCPDTIRPAPRLRWVDGKVEADFSEFDKAADWYFNKLGLPVAYTPFDFYLFGWGLPPKRVAGIAPYAGEPPYLDVDRSQLLPEYKQAYQALLRTFWDHVRQRGWANRFLLYLSDEPFAHQEQIRKQFLALCRMIHEVDPHIPIYSSTWRFVADWVEDLDTWGIGHYGIVPAEKIEELKSRGKRIWFTTDGQMCLDTPFCAIERLLPYYCFRFGVEGYEFWGVSWFTYDPHKFGWHAFIHQTDEPGRSYYIRYPNGDGYLIYPGLPGADREILSSIRLEQAREGVEDYEYLVFAQRLLEEFGRENRQSQLVRELEEALARILEGLSLPAPLGRYSTQILPQPEKLEQLRSELAAAIEAVCRELAPAGQAALR